MNIFKKVYRRAVMLVSQVHISKRRRAVRHVNLECFEMLALANEDVGRQILLFRDFEPDETEFFKGQLRPDDVCLDVGGNVGYFSMLMGFCVPKGQVHVFEPIPLNAALVRTNAELNRFAHVRVNNVAVGAEKGVAKFSESVDSAYSSMLATGRSAEERTIDVPVCTIDEYIKENAIERVDIIKVDVEGAEGLVIQGGSQLLKSMNRPRIVMLELYDKNLKPFNTNVISIVDHMESIGYKAKVLESKNELKNFSPHMANVVCNIFFITV